MESILLQWFLTCHSFQIVAISLKWERIEQKIAIQMVEPRIKEYRNPNDFEWATSGSRSSAFTWMPLPRRGRGLQGAS